ncbi:hypothetical protein WISP_127644 [Willisornis vidua]|uniref:Uncharacterized protein n=1 Tax=Willisornis vidua TaxID=1566151 RepID=A0ABQ9CWC4_9PASS|nr:hypothetical protein WISP_127644 [Willisornis vidua]
MDQLLSREALGPGWGIKQACADVSTEPVNMRFMWDEWRLGNKLLQKRHTETNDWYAFREAILDKDRLIILQTVSLGMVSECPKWFDLKRIP